MNYFGFALNQIGPVKCLIYAIILLIIISLLYKFLKSVITIFIIYVLAMTCSGIILNANSDKVVAKYQNTYQQLEQQVKHDMNLLRSGNYDKNQQFDLQKGIKDAQTKIKELDAAFEKYNIKPQS